MSRLQTRVVRLEKVHQERLSAACERLVRLLTDEELGAIVAMRDSGMTPEAEAAFSRIMEMATPEERLVLAVELPRR